MSETIEYRVRPVTRYIVTRSEQTEHCGSVEQRGEYPNQEMAHEVAYALASDEHRRLGYAIDDPRIKYPNPISRPPPTYTCADLEETGVRP